MCQNIQPAISFQVIVQRTLAAKNISHAKGGCVLAATLKLLPLFTLVMPGMAARVLFKNEVWTFVYSLPIDWRPTYPKKSCLLVLSWEILYR